MTAEVASQKAYAPLVLQGVGVSSQKAYVPIIRSEVRVSVQKAYVPIFEAPAVPSPRRRMPCFVN